MGWKHINAIMACMSLRGLSESQGTVERYNYDTQQRDKVQATIFPELMGKPVGLVLQKTEYEKMRDGMKTGETGWRLEPAAYFRAADEFTSSEILDRKTKPEKLAAIIAVLADRPLKNRPAARQQQSDSYSSPPAGHPAGSGFDGMDDDSIPFRDPLAYRGVHLVY